jgi:hypothetical protein
MKKESIIMESVYRAYNDELLDMNHVSRIYEAVYTEGANMTIMREHKKNMVKFKKFANDMRRIAKKGDPKDKEKFEKLKAGALAALDESTKIMNETKSTVGSAVLGYFAIGFIDLLKWWLPAMMTFGLAMLVPQIHELIDLIQAIVDRCNGGEDSDLRDTLNLFKQRYRSYVRMNTKIIDAIEKKYNENIKKKDK